MEPLIIISKNYLPEPNLGTKVNLLELSPEFYHLARIITRITGSEFRHGSLEEVPRSEFRACVATWRPMYYPRDTKY